jgi:hypothetical protein
LLLHINQIRDINDLINLPETSSDALLDTICSWHGISSNSKIENSDSIRNEQQSKAGVQTRFTRSQRL